MLRSVLLLLLLGSLLGASLLVVRAVDRAEQPRYGAGPERGVTASERVRRARRAPGADGNPAPGGRRAAGAASAATRNPSAKGRIRAVVVDDVGQAIPFLRAWVRPADEAEDAAGAARAPHPIDGRDGQLEIFGLEPGRWRLRVVARGHMPATTEVELPMADSREQPVRVTLRRMARVEGRVLFAGDAPALGVQVGIGPTGGEKRWIDVDEEARFLIPNVLPGTVELTARLEGGEALADTVTLTLGPGQRRQGVTIHFRARGTLTGELTGAIEPRADRRILVVRRVGGEPHHARTDATGRFELEVPIGHYRVMLDWNEEQGATSDWVDRYADRWEESAAVEKDRTTHVRLGVPSPEAMVVEGRVVARGKPAAGVVVGAQPPGEGRPTTMARTDLEGRFELSVPRPGPYHFLLGTGIEGQCVYPRELVADTLPRLTLSLPQGAIHGRVRSPTGNLAGAVVRALRKDPPEDGAPRDGSRVTVTATDGTFELVHLAPGVYDVCVSAPVTGTAERLGMRWIPDLRVSPDRTLADVEADLAPESIVRGTVRDAHGEPVVGARVLVLDASGSTVIPTPEVVTDEAGAFLCTGLGRGLVHLRVVQEEGRSERRVTLEPGTEVRVQLRL